jgi:hypothetical protein
MNRSELLWPGRQEVAPPTSPALQPLSDQQGCTSTTYLPKASHQVRHQCPHWCVLITGSSVPDWKQIFVLCCLSGQVSLWLTEPDRLCVHREHSRPHTSNGQRLPRDMAVGTSAFPQRALGQKHARPQKELPLGIWRTC